MRLAGLHVSQAADSAAAGCGLGSAATGRAHWRRRRRDWPGLITGGTFTQVTPGSPAAAPVSSPLPAAAVPACRAEQAQTTSRAGLQPRARPWSLRRSCPACSAIGTQGPAGAGHARKGGPCGVTNIIVRESGNPWHEVVRKGLVAAVGPNRLRRACLSGAKTGAKGGDSPSLFRRSSPHCRKDSGGGRPLFGRAPGHGVSAVSSSVSGAERAVRGRGTGTRLEPWR